MQAVHRLAAAVQHIGVGRTHGVRENPIAHITAVNEEVLGIGPRPARGRMSYPSVQPDARGPGVDFSLR